MLSFLFPPICPLCAKELLDKGEHICKICSKKQIFIKEPTCYSCGKSMKNQEKEYCSDCRQHPKNFERGMGLCIYQKPVTDSLAAIKYKNERKFAKNGIYCPNVSKSHVTVVRNVSAKNSNAADKICMINPIRAFKIPITIADKNFTPLS